MLGRRLRISSDAVTAATSTCYFGGYVARSESVAERVRRWYIEPLRAIPSGQGFIILMLVFPLYEKHLRVGRNMKGDFSEGHSVFRIMGRHLALNAHDAYLFWTHVRNGLLHHGLPRESADFKYALRSTGPPVEREEDTFLINAVALRDHLLTVIEPDMKTWREDDVSLPVTLDPGPRA